MHRVQPYLVYRLRGDFPRCHQHARLSRGLGHLSVAGFRRRCQRTHKMMISSAKRWRWKAGLREVIGFKSLYKARRALMCIKLVPGTVKGQFRVPAHFGAISLPFGGPSSPH
jgi:hypothetical protein